MIGRECGDMIGTAGPSSRCRTGPGPRSATPTATSSAAASGATAAATRTTATVQTASITPNNYVKSFFLENIYSIFLI